MGVLVPIARLHPEWAVLNGEIHACQRDAAFARRFGERRLTDVTIQASVTDAQQPGRAKLQSSLAQ